MNRGRVGLLLLLAGVILLAVGSISLSQAYCPPIPSGVHPSWQCVTLLPIAYLVSTVGLILVVIGVALEVSARRLKRIGLLLLSVGIILLILSFASYLLASCPAVPLSSFVSYLLCNLLPTLIGPAFLLGLIVVVLGSALMISSNIINRSETREPTN